VVVGMARRRDSYRVNVVSSKGALVSRISLSSSRFGAPLLVALAMALPATGAAQAAGPSSAAPSASMKAASHGRTPSAKRRRPTTGTVIRQALHRSGAAQMRMVNIEGITVASVLRPWRCSFTSSARATCDLVFLGAFPAAYYTYTMDVAMIDGVWLRISDKLEYGYGE
jgi:hypothetical protein